MTSAAWRSLSSVEPGHLARRMPGYSDHGLRRAVAAEMAPNENCSGSIRVRWQSRQVGLRLVQYHDGDTIVHASRKDWAGWGGDWSADLQHRLDRCPHRPIVFSNPEMSMNGAVGGAEGGCEGEG